MMPTSTDPLDHVGAYRPTAASTGREWPQPSRQALLDRVMSDSDNASTVIAPHPRRRARRVAIVGAAVIVPLAAVAAAAAAGYLPVSVRHYLSGDDGSPGYTVDVSSARQVVSIPGPHHTEFAVWTAKAGRDGQCAVIVFEPRGTTTPPTSLRRNNESSCAFPATGGLFGGAAAATTHAAAPGELDYFAYRAGDAVRGELRLSNGTILPVIVDNGWIAGWFTPAQLPADATAVLIAYDKDGRRIGSLTVQRR